MKIQDNDIASIEPFGMLDGKTVNLVKTKGGLNLATVMDPRGSETVLGAASHQAILCYTVEQRYPSFQPALMKSEGESKLNAESHSHFLTEEFRKSGYDIYSIQKGNEVDFYITNQNIRLELVSGSIENDKLMIKKETAPKNINLDVMRALESAVSEKALSVGLKGVKVQ